jgi:hypothetical protein
MELWLGPGRDGSSFQSDEHRRAMWLRHRERVMGLWAKGGKRPDAWWRYEASAHGLPPRHPGTAHERSILYEFSNALGEEERAELEAWWRKEFDRTWEPGFVVTHEGELVTGQGARELHWIWADLPLVLHDRWIEERKRHGRTIRKLKKASAPEQPADAAAEDDGGEPGAALA